MPEVRLIDRFYCRHKTSIAGINLLRSRHAGLLRRCKSRNSLDEVGFLKIIEILQDGRRRSDVYRVLDAARRNAATDMSQQKCGKALDGSRVFQRIANDDIPIKDVIEQFRQHHALPTLYISRESAD